MNTKTDINRSWASICIHTFIHSYMSMLCMNDGAMTYLLLNRIEIPKAAMAAIITKTAFWPNVKSRNPGDIIPSITK